MTEAILTLGVFVVPILAVAVAEQRKQEKQRRKRELALMREMEQIIQFKHRYCKNS
jgi:ABC-type Co2+ transport system permease subunit